MMMPCNQKSEFIFSNQSILSKEKKGNSVMTVYREGLTIVRVGNTLSYKIIRLATGRILIPHRMLVRSPTLIHFIYDSMHV